MRNPITEYELLREFPDVMSMKDMQKALGIGQNTAYNLVNSGAIPCKRIGRQIKILKSTLLEYLNN